MQSDSTPKTEFLNIAPEWTFLVSHESGFKYDSISGKTMLVHAELTELRMPQVTPQNHTRARKKRQGARLVENDNKNALPYTGTLSMIQRVLSEIFSGLLDSDQLPLELPCLRRMV